MLEWMAVSFSGDLLDPGIEPASPALAGRFFTAEPPVYYRGYSSAPPSDREAWGFAVDTEFARLLRGATLQQLDVFSHVEAP